MRGTDRMYHVKHRTEGEEDEETPNIVSSDRMKPRTKDNRQKTTAQTRVLTARSKPGIVPEIKGTLLFVSSRLSACGLLFAASSPRTSALQMPSLNILYPIMTHVTFFTAYCMLRLRKVMLMVWPLWATDHSRQYTNKGSKC